ncbi:COG1361 S-layer family protein [Acetobacterium paludosum]|nr:CARDB domain-containing protein [Acetobacterium paludosum]
MKTKVIYPVLVLSFFLFFCFTPCVLAAPEQPLLQISSVTFSPETVSPGKEFKMTITLTNHGDYDAQNVTLDVQSLAGTQDLGVFSMVGSGSHFYIEKIPSGESATIEIPMVSSPTAEAKNYNINLLINCEDSDGDEYNFTETVGIFINESASMSIIAPDQYTLVANDKGVYQLNAEIANYGSNPVRGVQLNISGVGLNFSSNSKYYGTFEKDDSDDFSTEVTADQQGDFPAKITLKYIDSFNNERTLEKDITIISPDNTKRTSDNADENIFQKFLRIVFGIGA